MSLDQEYDVEFFNEVMIEIYKGYWAAINKLMSMHIKLQRFSDKTDYDLQARIKGVYKKIAEYLHNADTEKQWKAVYCACISFEFALMLKQAFMQNAELKENVLGQIASNLQQQHSGVILDQSTQQLAAYVPEQIDMKRFYENEAVRNASLTAAHAMFRRSFKMLKHYQGWHKPSFVKKGQKFKWKTQHPEIWHHVVNNKMIFSHIKGEIDYSKL